MPEGLGISEILKVSVAETWARRNEFLRISWFPFLLLVLFFAVYPLYAGAVTRMLEMVVYIRGQPYTVNPDVFFGVFVSALITGWITVPLLKKILYDIQSREIPVDLRLGGHDGAVISVPVHFSPSRGALLYSLAGWLVICVFLAFEMALNFYLNYLSPANFLHALPFKPEFLIAVLLFVVRSFVMAWIMFAVTYLAVAETLKWSRVTAAVRAAKHRIVYIVVTNYLIFLPYQLLALLSWLVFRAAVKEHMIASYSVFYLSIAMFYACTMVWAVYACHLYSRFVGNDTTAPAPVMEPKDLSAC